MGLMIAVVLSGPLFADETPAQRLVAAASALNEIQADLDAAAPFSHLQRARAVAVLPDVVKVGLVLGGQVGEGVISVRGPDDHWGPPAFIKLLSGSVGWQAGVESSDVVLVFRSEEGMRKLIDGKLNLGGDVGIAVGHTGRQIDVTPETGYRAEVESYSRVRGLYAGLSFEGADLSPDLEANASLYGAEFSEVIAGRVVTIPGASRDFMNTLEKLAPASGNI
ncbi:MAG: lipid-binding SYLF domain-containing protein [Gammaproteobacteria bacterium]|nr:lipid-binding SYLF domain-containing protein [Gammaproteobacteria bacterium]